MDSTDLQKTSGNKWIKSTNQISVRMTFRMIDLIQVMNMWLIPHCFVSIKPLSKILKVTLIINILQYFHKQSKYTSVLKNYRQLSYKVTVLLICILLLLISCHLFRSCVDNFLSVWHHSSYIQVQFNSWLCNSLIFLYLGHELKSIQIIFPIFALISGCKLY